MRDLGCLLAMAVRVARRQAQGSTAFGLQVSIRDAIRDEVRPGAPTLVVTGEEGVLAVQSDRPDGVFDGVGVHLDASIGQEYLQAVPVAVEIAELFTQSGFGGGREDQKTIRGIVFPNDAALMDQPVVASRRSAGRIVPGG